MLVDRREERVIDDEVALHILEAGQSTGDGTYTIDPDGAGGNAPVEVYCDMTTDGGGYTFYPVESGGISTSRFDQANSCQAVGLELIRSFVRLVGDAALASGVGAARQGHDIEARS